MESLELAGGNAEPTPDDNAPQFEQSADVALHTIKGDENHVPPKTGSGTEVPARGLGGPPFFGWILGMAALALAALGVLAMVTSKGLPTENITPRIVEYRPLTIDGRPKNGPLATDGRYVYFSERISAAEGAPLVSAAVPIGGGEVLFPPNPVEPPAVALDVATRTQDLLYARQETPAIFTLFIKRQKQGLMERASQIGGVARISPDGRSIAYGEWTGGNAVTNIRDLGDYANARRIQVGG